MIQSRNEMNETIEMSETSVRHARILVVENDAAMLEHIATALRSIEIQQIATATNGVTAWWKLENGEQFDLVICDWVMPVTDELAVLRRLRAGQVAIPFILVTARDTEESIKTATDCGVTGYIAKPFSAARLKTEVFKVLEDSAILVQDADPNYWEI